jgi:hypothetical protein
MTGAGSFFWMTEDGPAAGALPALRWKQTAPVVVGPDEPFGDRSQTEMEALHWKPLVQTFRERGVVADAAKLRGLPHDVELSDRLLARTAAASTEEHREQGLD